MNRLMMLVATIILLSSPILACVGARPLGMGGAFIGLADDADATYWNPAALAFQDHRQIKGMLILSDEVNYKSNLSYVSPIGQEETSAWGLNIIGYNKAYLGSEDSEDLYMRPSMVKLCYARKFNDSFALGAALTRHATEFTWEYLGDEIDSIDSDGFGIDIAAYGRINDQLTWGVLVQDVNEPTEDIEGTEIFKWIRNVRPGIAYRASEALVLTADIYNLLGEADMDPTLCVGGEYKLQDGKYAVRGGVYGLSGDNEMLAVGGSMKINESFSVDAALLDGKPIIGGSYTF